MSYNRYNRGFEIDEEKAADFLSNAVDRVNTEEDIDTLVELYKLFKKNVPLSRRKYVIAYILKNALVHYRYYGRSNRGFDRNSSRQRTDARPAKTDYKAREYENYDASASATENAEEHPRHQRVEIPSDKASTIFVSIGKNRRVYPRDLVGLLVSVTNVDRERIGDIKVLANYSFIQLYSEDAQSVIDKLNGYDYRGRKLAVSFSRMQGDVPLGNAALAEDSDAVSNEMAAEDAAAYAAAEKAASDKAPFGVN